MTDLLTTEENLIANAAGWRLQHVYDQSESRVIVMVLPHPLREQFDAKKLMDEISMMARMGDSLCTKAVRLIMQSWTKGKK